MNAKLGLHCTIPMVQGDERSQDTGRLPAAARIVLTIDHHRPKLLDLMIYPKI